jgi:hypothetical protein
MLMAGFVPIQTENAQRISRPFRKISFASRRGIFTIPEGDIKLAHAIKQNSSQKERGMQRVFG